MFRKGFWDEFNASDVFEVLLALSEVEGTIKRRRKEKRGQEPFRPYDLLADGSITKEIFNSKLKEWKEKRAELEAKMAQKGRF